MSSRGRPLMDEGLRITVGNDVFFQRSNSPRRKSQSPSGDLRNRLGPRPNTGPRAMEERMSEYPERMTAQQFQDQRNWLGQGKQWSPKHSPYDRRPESEKYTSDMSTRPIDTSQQSNVSRYSGEQYFSQATRGRSPNQRYSRSPKSRSPPSRRGNRSPYGDSPRRRGSPRGYLRKSPSPHRHSRSRRRSSSDSSGSRSRSSHRNSSRARPKPAKATLGLAEDLLLTMYSGSRGAPDVEKARHGYLHPSLDTAPPPEKRKSYQNREELSHGYRNPSVTQDGHALNTLTEAYGSSPPARKRYDHTLDDEDRFLYGDGAPELRAEQQYNIERERRDDSSGRMGSTGRKRSPETHHRIHGHLSPERQTRPILKSAPQKTSAETQASQSGENEQNKVTPGGFDSKALKNVLKAIGFDFELSKQSLEKAAHGQPDESIMKMKEAVSVSKESKTKKNPTEPQKLQPAEPNVQPQPQKPSMPTYQPNSQSLPMPVYGTEYQLQTGQFPGAQYVHPQVLPAQTGGGVYIYQPQVSGPPQLVYQQHPMPGDALSLYSNVQQLSTQPNLNVVKPVPQEKPKSEQKPDKTAEEERRARKQRLKFLEIELQKLKRQQLQLVKKKQRQAGVGDQELLRQNSLLQAGVEKQIQDLRLATGNAVESSSDSSESDSDESEDDSPIYQFIDPGNHTCRICNEKNPNLLEYLEHLHTKIHKKQMDPSDKPWMKKVSQKNKKKIPNSIPVPLKGAEFLMPVLSFYCKICKEHFTDELKAEDHCFGKEHNQKYKKFCKDHPQYEKVRDVGHAVQKIKKLKEEFASGQYEKRKDQQEEITVEQRPKIKQEKPRGSPDERHIQERHRDERFVVEKHRKSPYERPMEERPKSFQDKTPPRRPIYDDIPYERPKEEKFKRVKSPTSRHSYGNSPYRRPSPEPDNRSKKLASKRKYDESPSDRYPIKEEKKATRHGGRWSPGYDDHDRHNSPYNPPSRPGSRFSGKSSGKPQGLGFGKFTWKRTDKKDNIQNEPELPKKSPFKDKPTAGNKDEAKGNLKSPGIKPQTFPQKTKMGAKVANLTPSTQVRTTKPPQVKNGKAPTKVTAPMNAVLAASTRPIPAAKTTRPLGIAKPGSETKKAVTEAVQVEEKEVKPQSTESAKQEPPPPGTEDIFVAPDDGNASDASGISMELASDEES